MKNNRYDILIEKNFDGNITAFERDYLFYIITKVKSYRYIHYRKLDFLLANIRAQWVLYLWWATNLGEKQFKFYSYRIQGKSYKFISSYSN